MITIKTNKKADISIVITNERAEITFNEDTIDNYVELSYKLDFDTTGEEYVLFPACCYDGNRFEVLKKQYPPLFTPKEAHVDMPVTITDVPRLNKDGSGKIEVTTGDLSVPCVGVYSKEKKQAVLFYTIQEIDGINLGLSYEKGKIEITYPHMRENGIYRGNMMQDEKDCGIDFEKGEKLEFAYKILEFSCESMEEFFEVYFKNRKCMGLEDSRPKILPFNKQFEIQRDKFNAMNWREAGGFYGVGTDKSPSQTWQPGWVGGGMSSFALMKLGGDLEWERGIKTLNHLFNTQAPSGFFYECSDENGKAEGMGFGGKGTENYHLIRKSADVLYFLFKHFNLMKERNFEIPLRFIEGTKKLTNSFVKMWDKYGQFGQFVDLVTGKIIAGGSTSGGVAPAGLVSAYRFFGEEKYLQVAKESAEMYYKRDAQNGYTTGGPGEILQCPDSESAAGLLESFVELYDETREEKWLEYSIHMANLCSSWVVSYNYKFPQTSEFNRLDMKTVGSVFANVQNKHSAPGFCTLSGNGLYKLYTWTKNEMYLELLKDISLTISQYMSTKERPIYSWDVPKDAVLMGGDNTDTEREKLPQGFICERVNMSDWETDKCVGGVFNGSCWPETSNLLTLAEVVELL